jgi:hypothetical protein
MSENNLCNLYQRLMSINQEAFAGGYYDIAYHTLAAALHCAQSLNDEKGLSGVERVAEEQLEWIDLHHPEYRYSTQSSSKRGHPNIYGNLIRQVKAIVLINQREMKKQGQP